MENTFKSSVFGGFNRNDVIRYIEKTSLESKQQIEALEQESDGLCRENAELRDKLAAAERERDKFAESYSTASSAQDALKKGLTAAQETISELRAQIEEGAQKLAIAKADCDRQLKAKEEAAEQRIAELEAQHAERLSAAKQERIRKTAAFYLMEKGLDCPVRFDVAEVYTDGAHSPAATHIEYIENAF